MASAPARCGRCAGTEVRAARSRHALHRRVRSLTPLERYACGECGHRGWRLGKLSGSEAGATSVFQRPAGGRRERDMSAFPPIAAALALGAATAWFILRMGAGRS